MNYTRDGIGRIAGETGFRAEYVERVLWLMEFLEGLSRHPFLQGRLALKGGTALNLFYYPCPRLSVDIDMNYIGSPDRETMLQEKAGIEQAVEGVCQRLGLAVRRKPEEHAGGKWSIRHPSVLTAGGNLELDLNYLLRVPFWPAVRMPSVGFGERRCEEVLVLDLHEIAAGKLAALFARCAPRDVFDAVNLLGDARIEARKLRLAFVLYGAMSRRDWRDIRTEDVSFPEAQFRNEVTVLLSRSEDAQVQARELEVLCRVRINEKLLPFRDDEMAFLQLINEQGVVRPDLITADERMRSLIALHPALQWKAQSVRKHLGFPDIGP